MCMIGQLHWAVNLGRYDILAQVMSMSRFGLAPKIGHLERLKRLYGYVCKTKHFAIRYRTREPNYSHLPVQEHDWSRTVYGNDNEEIPKDIPKLLGIRAITTTFLDANLLHDIVTGKSVTAVLLVEFWGLPPLIPLLQCVNRLGFEICSVNSCQSEQGSLVTLI